MARAVIGLAALAFVTVSATSSGGQRDPGGPDRTAVLRGTVIAADTRVPVHDVVVSLRPLDAVPIRRGAGQDAHQPGLPAARTDPGGRFELAGVAAGRYRVAVDVGPATAAYLPIRYPDPSADTGEPLVVSPGQVLEDLVIALPRAAAITGRVSDEHGNPLAFVSVAAQELLPGGRRRHAPGPMSGAGARTDDRGSFRLFGLRPGDYVVAAQPLPQMYLSVEATSGGATGGNLPPIFFFARGGVAMEAAPIRLASGDERGPIEIVVTAVRLHTVRGQLIDPTGQPVPGIGVQVHRESAFGGASVQGTSTRPDGTFEIQHVPAGQYAIRAHRYGPQGSQFASLQLTVADDVEGLTLQLRSGTSVNGKVEFEGRRPTPLPTMYVRSDPDSPGRPTNSIRVMPDADLSFVLEHQIGPTVVGAEPPAGWHLKAVLHGGRDVTDRPVEFHPGSPPVVVVLTQRAASLNGVVRSNRGSPVEASVIVFSEDPTLWHERASTTRTVHTTVDGTFSIEGLRGGRYLAIATIREEGAAGPAPVSYFELLARHATAIEVGDGEVKTVELRRATLR